jgi:23S rRNA pseudouridine1911/1915/1917 synthase
VFARTSKALTRLNELFKNRETEKTYWAIVKNKPERAQAKLIHYIKRNEKKQHPKLIQKRSS